MFAETGRPEARRLAGLAVRYTRTLLMPSRAKPLDPPIAALARADSVARSVWLERADLRAALPRRVPDQMSSVEGVFIALARYMRDHAGDLYWCPLWFGGMPFQNTYPPLLHALVALVSATVRISPALAYHAVTAFFYCLETGHALLASQETHRPHRAELCGRAAVLLVSPSAALLPEIRADIGGLLHARRLQCVVHYGEGPHVASLALIPLAILTLELAFTSRRPIHFFLAVLACMAVVLTNWPGRWL